MGFTIDESFMPATLSAAPMTDKQFEKFCAGHPDLFFEMTAEGELIVMAPAFSLTGMRNVAIGAQLHAWAERDGRGFSCDSSTGFVLPNGARRSPDASWTEKTRIQGLAKSSREGFWHLCPDFVIELKSQTDRMKTVRNKMIEYLENGAQLGWLIDPVTRVIEIYRPTREPELLTGLNSINGEGPAEGFVLQLARVWDPLG